VLDGAAQTEIAGFFTKFFSQNRELQFTRHFKSTLWYVHIASTANHSALNNTTTVNERIARRSDSP